MMFKPMKSSPVNLATLRYPVYASPKLDGIRCVVRDGKLWSNSNKLIPNVNVQAKFKHLEGCDGELIAGEPNTEGVWNHTMSIVSSKNKSANNVSFYVFDSVLSPDLAYDLRYKSLLLASLNSREQDRAQDVLYQKLIHNEEQLLAYEEYSLAEGYEGIMLRSPSAPYKYGRSTANEQYLLKMKRFQDDEAIVVGFTEKLHNLNPAEVNELGHLHRSSAVDGKVPAGTLGSIQAKFKDQIINIRGSITDEEALRIWNNQAAYLGKSCKFKHMPYGAKDTVRQGIFLGWRDDFDLSGD
jgi:DNA ligase-1